MLLAEANASHGIAFRPLVDLLFPKMNGPLLTSVLKKAYSGNGNCASLWSSKDLRERARIFLNILEIVWLIFIELPKLTSLLLIVSHNMIGKRKIGIRSIA